MGIEACSTTFRGIAKTIGKSSTASTQKATATAAIITWATLPIADGYQTSLGTINAAAAAATGHDHVGPASDAGAGAAAAAAGSIGGRGFSWRPRYGFQHLTGQDDKVAY